MNAQDVVFRAVREAWPFAVDQERVALDSGLSLVEVDDAALQLQYAGLVVPAPEGMWKRARWSA